MTGTKVQNLYGDGMSSTPDKISAKMADRLREFADKAERGEVSAMFIVTMSPALGVEADWLGQIGTTLSLRGALAIGVAKYDEVEL